MKQTANICIRSTLLAILGLLCSKTTGACGSSTSISGKAEPIEKWGYGSSNLFFSRVDDRTFLHKVSPDFSETQIFEIMSDGTFKQELTVPGYAIVLVRVR